MASTTLKPQSPSRGRSGNDGIGRILGIELPVSVVLAERLMCIQSILQVKVGTIIEFESRADGDLVLRVANRAIGSGQTVKVGENFGLRISRIGSIAERIDAMSGR